MQTKFASVKVHFYNYLHHKRPRLLKLMGLRQVKILNKSTQRVKYCETLSQFLGAFELKAIEVNSRLIVTLQLFSFAVQTLGINVQSKTKDSYQLLYYPLVNLKSIVKNQRCSLLGLVPINIVSLAYGH